MNSILDEYKGLGGDFVALIFPINQHCWLYKNSAVRKALVKCDKIHTLRTENKMLAIQLKFKPTHYTCPLSGVILIT